MGEGRYVKYGFGKSRPLGHVKEETVYFQSNESDTSLGLKTSLLLDTLRFFTGSATVGRRVQDAESMSEFRLGRAALANIVAVVNSESKSACSAMGIQSVGAMGSSLLGDTVSKGESNGELFHSGADIKHSGLRNLHFQRENTFCSTIPPAPPNTAASPNTAKSLMSDRSKNTITPRSVTRSSKVYLNENNNSDVSVELANMVDFRTFQNPEMEYKPVNVKSSETVSEDRQTLLTRTQRIPTMKVFNDHRFKSDGETITSYALCGTGLNNSVAKNHSTSAHVRTVINVSQNVMDTNTNERNNFSYNSPRSRCEDHQSQLTTKIHISPMKREPFKKQTEVPKCDAIFIGDPITSYILYGASPMLLVAQNKESSRLDGSETTKETSGEVSAFDHRRTEYPFPSNINLASTEPLVLSRETKQINNFDLSEGLRIVSLNLSTECATISETHTTNTNGQHKLGNKSVDDIQNNSRSWTQENTSSDLTTKKNVPQTNLPSYLDIRPLTTSPSQFTRSLLSGRKSMLGTRRSKSLNLRDKFRLPSPGSSQISLEKLTTSNEDFSLVGQSLPSVSNKKTTTKSSKPLAKIPSSEAKLVSRESYWGMDVSSQTSWHDLADFNKRQEASYQNEGISSTTLTLPGVYHKQKCDDKVLVSTPSSHNKGSSVLTSASTGQEGDKNMKLETYQSNKIDLLNNDGEVHFFNSFTHGLNESVLEAEALTMRSLIDHGLETNYLDSSSLSPRKAVDNVLKVKEPLYMGCSSQVAEMESRSQFHYINNCGDGGNNEGGYVKVIKALDQDVYSDYQHKKYRDGNVTTTLNTAADQPRMHFLKIKVTEDSS